MKRPDMPSVRDLARWFVPPVTACGLALGLALALRLWIRAGLDLRDLPGPASAQIIAQTAAGELHKGWTQLAIGRLAPYLGGDIAAAALNVSLTASTAAVLGAMLAGWALAGRWAALGTGLVAGTWSIGVLLSLIIGPDPLALGMSWLALGLVWAGARTAPLGVPIAWGGAALLMFAAVIKESALPVLGLVALAPLLVRARLGVFLLSAPALWGGMMWFWRRFATARIHRTDLQPSLEPAALVDGWMRIAELPHRAMAEGVLEQLVPAALVLALIPGPRPRRRLLVALASVALLLLTADALDEVTRPRYQVSASAGVIITVGTGLGLIMRALTRLPLPRVVRRLAWLPALALPALLLLDTLAFANAWGTRRAEITGADLPSLPAAPANWAWRYRRMTDIPHRDLTIYGGVDLVELVNAHPGGVAVPRLRDDRQSHLVAAAALAGNPHVVLDAGICCRAFPMRCADSVVAALDAAGVLIALPSDVKGIRRVNKSDDQWLSFLVQAAQRAGDLTEQGRWWRVREATGSGGALPCQGEGRRSRGKRQQRGPG